MVELLKLEQMTIQTYSYLKDRPESEVETALTYFESRILSAKKHRTGNAWLSEALPMMEQGARTAKEILANFRKSDKWNYQLSTLSFIHTFVVNTLSSFADFTLALVTVVYFGMLMVK